MGPVKEPIQGAEELKPIQKVGVLEPPKRWRVKTDTKVGELE